MVVGVSSSTAAALDGVAALRDPMLERVGELIRIPSIGGSDAECDVQRHVADLLARGGMEVDTWRLDLADLTARDDFPGMEVERDEAWGVVGRLPGAGDGATLMLNGHVDVVPTGDDRAWTSAPFDGEVRGDAICGRGACDMKAGVIAAHWAVQAIRQAGVRLRGDLLLASVVGEEDGGLGTYATLDRGWRADACIVPEPTDLDIVAACSGALTFRLRVPGAATHAARRAEGVSAIEKFVPILHALDDLERRRHETVDPLFDRWPLAHPLSVGTIHAGDWASSVPDALVAEGRLGVAVDEPVDDARRAFETAVADACAADAWLRDHPVEVEWWGGQFASGRLAAESDLGERLAAAHRLSTGGAAPDTYGAPYGSDLRLLSGIGGIPTVLYGPGDAVVAHGPDELVPIEQIEATARTLVAAAIDVCGTA